MTTTRIVRSYLALSALATFAHSFTMVTYVLYLREHNLNYFTSNVANLTFFIAMLLFELPTGAFADLFGRRASFVASCISWALAGLVFANSTTLPGIMTAETLAALGAALSSGAFQSWFVDRLHHHGYSGSMRSFFFRERAWNTGATIIAGVIGAAIASYYGRETVWFLEAIALLIVAIVALAMMKEEYFTPRHETMRHRVSGMYAAMKAGFDYGRGHPKIRFLFTMGLALSFAVQAPNMQWQPAFQALGLSQFDLGLAMAGTQIMLFVGAAAGLWAARRILDEKRLLRWILGFAGLSIAATLLTPSLGIALGILLAHEFFRGAYQPVKDAYLHDQIAHGDQRRATILSFESLSMHAGSVAGLLMSGAVAQLFSPAAAWVSSGLTLIAAVIWLGRNGRGT